MSGEHGPRAPGPAGGGAAGRGGGGVDAGEAPRVSGLSRCVDIVDNNTDDIVDNIDIL